MKKLRVAIIGQGRSGKNIHGAFFRSEANDKFEVVAVVDMDEVRRNRAKDLYEGCEVYSDYTELFGRDDIDLVVNSTYSDMHYPVSIDLMNHGFNVLVEKPMARTRYECEDMIKTAKENNVTLAVFQQSFFAPFYQDIKNLMASGKLGEIQQVSIKYNNFARRWDWQTLQVKNAGGLYNTGPHPVGFVCDMLGFSDEIKVEYSKLARCMTSGDSDDFAKAIITAPGKPVVDLEVISVDAYSPFNVKLFGSRGCAEYTPTTYKYKYVVYGENPERPVVIDTLRLENGEPTYCAEKLITHEEEGKFDGTAFDIGTKNLYNTVYEKIVNGTPLPIGPEHGAKIIGVIEAIHAQNPLERKY